MEHKKPWWFRLAEKVMPDRCREIPESVNPDRILLRQVAIIPRTLYLQQFASGEDPRYLHRHEFRRAFCIGLWGSYTERRLTGPEKRVRAPYAYSMGPDVIHQVTNPSKGHASLFLGIGRIQERRYFSADDASWSWEDHVKKRVKRI